MVNDIVHSPSADKETLVPENRAMAGICLRREPARILRRKGRCGADCGQAGISEPNTPPFAEGLLL